MCCLMWSVPAASCKSFQCFSFPLPNKLAVQSTQETLITKFSSTYVYWSLPARYTLGCCVWASCLVLGAFKHPPVGLKWPLHTYFCFFLHTHYRNETTELCWSQKSHPFPSTLPEFWSGISSCFLTSPFTFLIINIRGQIFTYFSIMINMLR